MSTSSSADPSQYQWEPQPASAALVTEWLTEFIDANPDVSRLAIRMREETGTRLIDWVDHFGFAKSSPRMQQVATHMATSSGGPPPRFGFVEGLFPDVLELPAGNPRLAIKVECLDLFLSTHPWAAQGAHTPAPEHQAEPRPIDAPGTPASPFRWARISDRGGHELWIVENHGCRHNLAASAAASQNEAAGRYLEVFRNRLRDEENCIDTFQQIKRQILTIGSEISPTRAQDAFFAAEREYWMDRNHAARVQYDRQQALGLGWANHDHHTYRSSRACFHMLIAVLEQLGLVCRERFYAGREAGWGAQVLESPETGIVVFADVDLSPEEIACDFAHVPLPPRDQLGTVGLWCALHGESFLRAGMHHLECQFDFGAARTQLAAAGIQTMAPFTNLPHLKQAFTQGEMWAVEETRIARLLAGGQITPVQAEQFRREGALGSHLEILERNDGYKGFNQTGVSEIIARTDPRKW